MPSDTLFLSTPTVRVGRFSCRTSDASFRDTGPTEHHLVVFPRHATWIRHAGASWFAADAAIATTYNHGQEYERAAISPAGDESDWFGLVPETASEVLEDLATGGTDVRRPFTRAFVSCDLSLYLAQRELVARIARGEIEPLEAEERVLRLIGGAIAASTEIAPVELRGAKARAAHRRIVEQAKAELGRDLAERDDVTTLARSVGVSPFHLCRVFLAATGQTLHGYRLDLRVRAALARLEDTQGLSRLAQELGFTSHSHFTSVVRRCIGSTPSLLRLRLRVH